MKNANHLFLIALVSLFLFSKTLPAQETAPPKKGVTYICPPCGCESDGVEFGKSQEIVQVAECN